MQFQLDRALDADIALAFIQMSAGGIDFSNGIIGPHPNLKSALTEVDDAKRRGMIDAFVDEYYEKEKDSLELYRSQLETDWGEVSTRFFKAVSDIFSGHEFPDGKYIGYISIFDCNPRFLDDKTFQVYQRHELGGVFVTAHELLHFIFYDYAKRSLPDLFDGVDTEEGLFWDVAELFNSVILATDPFVEVHGVETASVYPDHKQYMDQLSEEWMAHHSVDLFIRKAYELVKDRV